MKGLAWKLAELQRKIGDAITRMPFYPAVLALSRRISAPLVRLCIWTLDAAPWIRKLEWLLEVERLATRQPVALALSMVYVVWRGVRTTSLGHIGTDPVIYPLMGAISGFNPFLGVVCAGLFGIADLCQKLVWPDIYGARGWSDLNYWGAMGGYVVAYSSVLFMAVFPGMMSRVFRKVVGGFFRKRFERAAAGADGATPSPSDDAYLLNLIAGVAGGYFGGYLSMNTVAPVAEMPAFLWRPQPDISCHRLEVDTHLQGRAWIGGAGGAIGGAVTTLVPDGGGTPPAGPPPQAPKPFVPFGKDGMDPDIENIEQEPDADVFTTPLPTDEQDQVANNIMQHIDPETLDKLTKKEWDAASEAERQALTAKIAEQIGKAYGISTPVVNYTNPPPDIPADSGGWYDASTRPPTICINPNSSMTDSPMGVIWVVAHELKHVQQGDPNNPMENKKARGLATKNEGNYHEATTDYDKYAKQYIERDANSMGKKVSESASKSAYSAKLDKLAQTLKELTPDPHPAPPPLGGYTSIDKIKADPKGFIAHLDKHPDERTKLLSIIKTRAMKEMQRGRR